MWHNGEKVDNVIIEDDVLLMPSKGIKLKLDKRGVLESEKKILDLVKKLTRYLPGFNKSMPLQFLMADEYKWLSKSLLLKEGAVAGEGWAIHEFVNFKQQAE